MRTLKHITTALLLLVSISITAQQGINYKALIKDGGGNVVSNQGITVQFQILKGAGMSLEYQESHTPNTDENGIVMINIGEGVVDSGVYANIDWGADEHHLNVQIDTGGGLTDMGTTQFMAVPYALSVSSEALKIDDLSDGKSDDDGSEDGSSLYLGIGSGINDDGTDNQNVGIGFQALNSNTSGYSNSAIGFQSLSNNTTGYENTASGQLALFNNDTGNRNMASGFLALISNTEGNENTASGYLALSNNTIGNNNIAIGSLSLGSNMDGHNNTGIGYFAGFENVSGIGNVFIGSNAGFYETNSNKLYIENSDADADNALIYGEFDTNILRTNSEFQIGNPAGTGFAFPATDGTASQILQTDGNGALAWSDSVQRINDLVDGKSDDDGSEDGSSLYLGIGSGINDDGTDNQNVGIGFQALNSNTSGELNTANGYHALYSNTSGSGNSASGKSALFSNTQGFLNVANGYQALFSNTTGAWNTAIGTQALYYNTGSNNVANGDSALFFNTSGFANSAIGVFALSNNTTGSNNTAIGYDAGGIITTGSNNTAIGHLARVPDGTLDNQVRIGDNNVSYAGIQVAWDVTSDQRWKKQIRDVPYGLDMIKQLRPVDYIRKNNEHQTREVGFIGQEVEALLAELGYDDQGLLHKDDQGYISLRYNDFIGILTKAIQEQQVIIEEQENKYNALLKRVERLELAGNE